MSQTLEQFGKSVIAAGLMTKDELRTWFTGRPADQRPRDAEAFAAAMVADGTLSKYQSSVLLQGKPQALTFGHYLLVSQLGSGASGHVFKARHKHSGRDVAIKVLSAEVAQDPTSVKRFRREVEAAGRLEHRHIVRSVDAGEFNGQHYLVMEYVDGSDLASIVKSRGPLPVDEAIHCVLQAAAGFRFAHEAGVVHRDIKPGNLLLDKNGTVRILDLGLVRFEGGGDCLTATQQVMGTVDYMSPEQSADTKRADARADIYSLGVTLWYLLTGRRMYDSKNMVERIMMHRSAPIPPLTAGRPDAPPALDAVFQRMVAKRPDDRYQTMAEVGRALQGVLEGAQGSDEAAPAEVMELSIMSLSKGDLAAFLRAREELPEASLSAPLSAASIPDPTMSGPPVTQISGPLNFAVDTARRGGGKPAPTKRPTTPEADAAKTPANPNRKRLIIGLAATGAAAAIGLGIWLALK
jgi:eukaryotic-like serine/threonine-protein kinase